MARFTRARLDEDLRWVDVAGLAVLAAIGFTVSLLIGELAYGPDSARGEHVKVGCWSGRWRRLCEAEELETDQGPP